MKEIGPAISVVVPCYKAVRWLPECMDSLFEQTFEDFEIIFVDDGSPDATGKLVDDYAAKYPQVKTLHQKNEGVTCARRTGVAHAAGEWVCFVDADDRLPADALALLYKAAGEAYDLVIGFHHTRGVDTVLPVDELRHCCLTGELLPAAPWGKLIRRNETYCLNILRNILPIKSLGNNIFMNTISQFIQHTDKAVKGSLSPHCSKYHNLILKRYLSIKCYCRTILPIEYKSGRQYAKQFSHKEKDDLHWQCYLSILFFFHNILRPKELPIPEQLLS